MASSSSSKSRQIPQSPLVFDNEVKELVKKSKVLVVGAGGIGCELLKNLVLTGFGDIEIVDLDTIDVSNLNRQFLFQKKHVGKSKAEVAKQSVLKFNPNAKIVAHHASITGPDFGIGFIEKFDLVMNALDNRAARNHVNRLCLAAKIPLIESGTSGYNGQVELIIKGTTKCYECDPKAPVKTYPGCTIRNTPSEFIHCIVWAKHLFAQLFGFHDAMDEDVDVSPDPSDGDPGASARISTREWVKSVGYEPEKIFNKLFNEDINYLLSMKKLWETRRPPVPLKWDSVGDVKGSEEGDSASLLLPDQKLWSLRECLDEFANSLKSLKEAVETTNEGFLVWDKDDKAAMNFVTSAANIRSHIFGIPMKSRFDVKSMAGNIIPAIATSNAIIAGLIVLTALNVLRKNLEQCQSSYLRDGPGPRGTLIGRETCLEKPNPKCTVCSDTPQIIIATNTERMKLKEFESDVLKDKLNMVEPDLQLDSTGAVLLSSEEGETEQNNEKTLHELGVNDGTILLADDFVQNYKLTIIVRHRVMGREDPSFVIIGNLSELRPKDEQENGKETSQSTSSNKTQTDDDDDIELIEEDDAEIPKKRKHEDTPVPVKKRKTQNENDRETDADAEMEGDIIIL